MADEPKLSYGQRAVGLTFNPSNNGAPLLHRHHRGSNRTDVGGQSGYLAMIERKIKELSFALEALSRVNSYEGNAHLTDVSRLLSQAIAEAKEQTKEKDEAPKNISDDDIPF